MKQLKIFLMAVGLSVLFVSGMSWFNSFMRRQMEAWSESNFMPGILPNLAINLHIFIRKNTLLLVPLVMIVTFVGCFVIGNRKK